MEILGQLIPIILMFVVMYFLLIRPQKKQAEEKQNMLNNIEPGDVVLTIGGLYGVVDEVDSDERKVVLDCEGIYLTYRLDAIGNVVEKANDQKLENDSQPDAIEENTDQDDKADEESNNDSND